MTLLMPPPSDPSLLTKCNTTEVCIETIKKSLWSVLLYMLNKCHCDLFNKKVNWIIARQYEVRQESQIKVAEEKGSLRIMNTHRGKEMNLLQ